MGAGLALAQGWYLWPDLGGSEYTLIQSKSPGYLLKEAREGHKVPVSLCSPTHVVTLK